jgi:hypothetical protein
MKIKLSDYILEQSISEADTTDILLEQAMSELEVCTSLAYAYLKQLTMEEYMNPDGELTAEDVVTEASAEAAATTDGGGEEGGGVGAAVSNIGKGFAGFFKAVIGAITGFFRWVGNKIGAIGDSITKNGKQLAQKVANATEEQLNALAEELATTKKRDIASIYYSYNPSNVKTFYDTLESNSRKFAKETADFVEGCHYHFLGARLSSTIKNDKKAADVINRYSSAVSEFVERVRTTNPANMTDKNVKARTPGFKAMVTAYIQYYCSVECNSRIRSIKESIQKISKALSDFDKRWNLTRDWRKGYRGDDVSSDIFDKSQNEKFSNMREVLKRALAAVSGDSRNGALGAIKDLDGNLRALNQLGISHYVGMKDESSQEPPKNNTVDNDEY